MEIGITSIQRDRNPYILEWIAFHLVVGFNRFYIYSHKNQDGMNETLRKLSSHYPITLHEISTEDQPQSEAYGHSRAHHLSEVDWMAYIDGDEFLFPTHAATMQEALTPFMERSLSAIAVYWKIYGSSGHLADPKGLIMENFTRHSNDDYPPNSWIKSIVRGRDPSKVHGHTAHFFPTEHGTFDEQMRPILWFQGHSPSYDVFRINHYLVQSYDFYRNKKSQYPPPDGNTSSIRTLEAFSGLDRNDSDDGVRYQFLIKVKLKMEEIMLKLN